MSAVWRAREPLRSSRKISRKVSGSRGPRFAARARLRTSSSRAADQTSRPSARLSWPICTETSARRLRSSTSSLSIRSISPRSEARVGPRLPSADDVGRLVTVAFFGGGTGFRGIARLVEEGPGPVVSRNFGQFKRIDNHNGRVASTERHQTHSFSVGSTRPATAILASSGESRHFRQRQTGSRPRGAAAEPMRPGSASIFQKCFCANRPAGLSLVVRPCSIPWNLGQASMSGVYVEMLRSEPGADRISRGRWPGRGRRRRQATPKGEGSG